MFLHPTLAVAGPGVYLVHLGYHIKPLAWVAFADLLLVAVLGDALLVSWLKARRNELKAVLDPEHQEVARRIPPGAVAAHGTLAVVTIVMVLLVCLGV